MEGLEIDHINGRDYILQDMSQDMRVTLYKRELKEGKLRVLCREHNMEKRWASGFRNTRGGGKNGTEL